MESTIEKNGMVLDRSPGVLPPGTKRGKILQRVRFPLRSFYLMGTRVDNIDGAMAVKIISHYIESEDESPMRKIFFTNVHSICSAQLDWVLKHAINLGDLVLPDGSGVSIGGKVLGHPVIENLNGTDFTPRILQLAEERGWSVYFLGAEEHIGLTCCELVQRTFPRLRIAGYQHGYFGPDEERSVIDEINDCHPDILLTAFGTPKQELWLTRWAYELNAKISMGVGGLFDFLSLSKKRAPQWMRRFGIEWIYRFVNDPKEKWKRVFLEIPMFFAMLVAEKYIPKKIRHRIQRMVVS